MNAYEQSLMAAVKLFQRSNINEAFKYAVQEQLEEEIEKIGDGDIWPVGKDWWDKLSNFESRTVFCLSCKTKTGTALIDKSFGHAFGTEVFYREVTICCGGGWDELKEEI